MQWPLRGNTATQMTMIRDRHDSMQQRQLMKLREGTKGVILMYRVSENGASKLV